MQNNLQLFREALQEHLPSQQIANPVQFKQLVEHLCDLKLLHPDQAKLMIHRVFQAQNTQFPISFNQLQQIIMTQLGDQQCKQMLQGLANLKARLREVKGVLAIWRDRGLSRKQRLQLQAIFEKGNAKMREMFTELKHKKQLLQGICEQQEQMISALEEWVGIQKIPDGFKDYQQYQQHHSKLIDKLFNQIRVRDVHFPVRKNTAAITSVQTLTALDSRNDQPVTVTLIPKNTTDFNHLNQQLLTFNAQKQLLLSNHFARFLGYNTHTDPHCFQYFTQNLQGQPLALFMSQTQVEFDQQMPLFQYWCYQIYRSLYDAFLMTSYVLQLPVRVQDFRITHHGLKLVLANLIFSASRQQEPEFYQADLLENLGGLILGLLGEKKQSWGKKTSLKRIQNKSLMSCLLNVRKGHTNFKEGRVKHKISFFNLQTHPLFESPSLTNAETIIDSYQAISQLKH